MLSLDTCPVVDLDQLPGAREHALAVRPIEAFIGRFAFEGAWAWRWKDRIDRGFIAKYRGA